MGQIDYFLKLDGIDGESADEKHKGEIAVKSWGFGASNAMPVSAGSGAAVGKALLRDFHFVKAVDKASPRLLTACCAGERLKSATLTCRRSGRDQQEFLKVLLSNVVVIAFDSIGTADAAAGVEEQVSFAYGRVEFRYKEGKPDGSLGGETVGGWDAVANKKI